MIEQIRFALIDESNNVIPVEAKNVEMKIETAIADLFSEICRSNNSISDTEIKIAEKFSFALNLQNYLKEMKENERTNN